jgi:hypothetical protein
MALIYQAQLTPSKLEALSAWVPGQPWLGDADASALEVVGAYRFDDPAGEVGIETHLLQAAGGQVLQVPVTYRSGPLAGAESSLIATMQHSVLGERWVYDACADPVYAAALATAILTGGTEADFEVVTDSGLLKRELTVHVSGSGSEQYAVSELGSLAHASDGTTTVISTDNVTLVVFHVIGTSSPDAGDTLTGTWPGQDTPALLAHAS